MPEKDRKDNPDGPSGKSLENKPLNPSPDKSQDDPIKDPARRNNRRQAFIGTSCLNCGVKLVGEYCYECGQPAADVKQTLRGLIRDYGRSALSLDALLWKTLSCLLFKPGKLTEEYLHGHRMRYIAPLRLYLTWSFLFFLILSFMPQNHYVNIKINDDDSTDTTEEMATAQTDSLLESTDSDDLPVSRDGVDSTATPALLSDEDDGILGEDTGTDEIVSRILEQMPRAMFFLVPISAALIHLFYLRRRRPYLHHLVNALGVHTFGFIVLSIANLIQLLPGTAVDNIAQLIPLLIPVYAAFAFKRVYAGGWFKTICKVQAILILYLMCLGTSIVVIYLLFFQVFN